MPLLSIPHSVLFFHHSHYASIPHSITVFLVFQYSSLSTLTQYSMFLQTIPHSVLLFQYCQCVNISQSIAVFLVCQYSWLHALRQYSLLSLSILTQCSYSSIHSMPVFLTQVQYFRYASIPHSLLLLSTPCSYWVFLTWYFYSSIPSMQVCRYFALKAVFLVCQYSWLRTFTQYSVLLLSILTQCSSSSIPSMPVFLTQLQPF